MAEWVGIGARNERRPVSSVAVVLVSSEGSFGGILGVLRRGCLILTNCQAPAKSSQLITELCVNIKKSSVLPGSNIYDGKDNPHARAKRSVCCC